MPEEINGLLQVNQKLYVARDVGDTFYVSSVQDLEPEAVFIGMPMLRGMTLVLSRGDRIQVRLTREDASYFFHTSVIQVRDETIPLYGISWPENVERKQMRRHFRLNCLIDVSFAERPLGKRAPAWRTGCALDISAGGIRLQTDQVFSPETMLLLRFSLPLREGTVDVETPARIIRRQCEDPPPGSAGKPIYRYGLEFLDLPARRQDEIMAFVFWKMTENRRVMQGM